MDATIQEPSDAAREHARAQAVALYEATGKAFTVMDCKRAMVICGNDMQRAADWLADGGWRTAKLISWDHASLGTKTMQLHEASGKPMTQCREVLMNCGGSLELAQRKLAGLPVLALS